MRSTRSNKARPNVDDGLADDASVPEEALLTPRPEEEESVNEDEEELAEKAFRPNDEDSSEDEEEGLEEDTPSPPKRLPRSKAKDTARSRTRSRGGSRRKQKFNIYRKPSPLAPINPPPPPGSFLVSPSFKKKDNATDKKDAYHEQLEEAREYAIDTHDTFSEHYNDATDKVQELTLFSSNLQEEYLSLKADFDKKSLALASHLLLPRRRARSPPRTLRSIVSRLPSRLSRIK